MSSTEDPTALTQRFTYQSSTHTYNVAHTTLGDPSSPPLIFIHGTPWTSQVYKDLAISLSKQFHVHLADNPGFGLSPLERPISDTCPEVTPPTFSFDVSKGEHPIQHFDSNLARQTEAWVALYRHWEQSWDGRKPHVLAHDHAGLMAVTAVLVHGCEFASLCLFDVVAIGPFGKPLFKTVSENPTAFTSLPDLAFEGIVESYIRNASFHPLSMSDLEELKKHWVTPTDEGGQGKEGFIRQLCAASYRSTGGLEERYHEIGEKIPVKIIWGKEDQWIGEESAWRLGEALKAKDVAIIEGAGHLIMYDQPAQFAVEVTRWLCTQDR